MLTIERMNDIFKPIEDDMAVRVAACEGVSAFTISDQYQSKKTLFDFFDETIEERRTGKCEKVIGKYSVEKVKLYPNDDKEQSFVVKQDESGLIFTVTAKSINAKYEQKLQPVIDYKDKEYLESLQHTIKMAFYSFNGGTCIPSAQFGENGFITMEFVYTKIKDYLDNGLGTWKTVLNSTYRIEPCKGTSGNPAYRVYDISGDEDGPYILVDQNGWIEYYYSETIIAQKRQIRNVLTGIFKDMRTICNPLKRSDIKLGNITKTYEFKDYYEIIKNIFKEENKRFLLIGEMSINPTFDPLIGHIHVLDNEADGVRIYITRASITAIFEYSGIRNVIRDRECGKRMCDIFANRIYSWINSSIADKPFDSIASRDSLYSMIDNHCRYIDAQYDDEIIIEHKRGDLLVKVCGNSSVRTYTVSATRKGVKVMFTLYPNEWVKFEHIKE